MVNVVLPKQKDVEIPLLEVLVEMGGQGKPKDIYPLVTNKLPQLREEDILETLPSGANKWTNRIQWVRKSLIKKRVVLMGETEGTESVKYIHGNLGKGTFTFLGGHDPEDYTHLVGDPPTQLSLHKNSPGYRLILNNILFPAAKKKEQKT